MTSQEVSNYARFTQTLLQGPEGGAAGGVSSRSQHNQIYWHGAPYAAYGNGAASFVHSIRASRPRSLESYCRWVEAGDRVRWSL